MLLTRSDTHPSLAGFYDLPGGMIEDGEEPGAAVIREVKEETGIELPHHAVKVIYTTTHVMHDKSYPTLLYLARIEMKSPDIQISWEHKSHEWAPLHRMADVEPQLASTYQEAFAYVRAHNIIEDIDIVVGEIQEAAA